MKVSGTILNNHQVNFLKELMGDVFMTDTRAEAILAKLSAKYGVNLTSLCEVINRNFVAKNEKLKELENAG